jgi:hypothetical protein
LRNINMKSDAEEILSQLYKERLDMGPWLHVVITNNANTAVSPNLKTFENPVNQTFDFPSTIMHYIWQEMTSDIYVKLLKTCKYFYLKERISVIRIACITTRDYHLSSDDSSFSKSTFFPLPHLHKIWFTNSLSVYSDDSFSSDLLSKTCKKIYKCTVTELCLMTQTITENEFNILVSPEFLLSIALIETSIMKSNGDKLNCEEIMQKIPKAIEVELQDISITSETFSKISNFSRLNKLRTFHLNPHIHDHCLIFDTKAFTEFVKRCAAPKADFDLHFEYQNKTRLAKDTDEMEQFLMTWIPFDEKPHVILF